MKIARRTFLSASAIAAAAAAIPARIARAFAPNLAADPRRPQFHFLPAANWMNDPNGPIYWHGKYHMFCQYNPHAAVWGDMHWAHAVSPDMIHWTHLPVALAPTPGGPDSEGCFSGTAVIHDNQVVFIYTGVQTVPLAQATLSDSHNIFRETQLYASSSDPLLRTFTKRPAPVIPAPPEGMKITGFRDPAPWREPSLVNGNWLMAVGSGEKDKGGAILLYESADLQNWKYLHAAITGSVTGKKADATNPVDSGDMWECPDLFPLGGKHLLIYSTQGKVFWKIGDLDPQSLLFREHQSGLLDYGSFYAPKTQLDKGGNRILWGWIPETRPEVEYSASGWSGLMSLPRTLTLGPDGRVRIAPAPAVERLRQREQKLRLTRATGGQQLLASQRLKDACGELLCTVIPTGHYSGQPGFEPFSLDLINPDAPKDHPQDANHPAPVSATTGPANAKAGSPDTHKEAEQAAAQPGTPDHQSAQEDTTPASPVPTVSTEASYLSIRYSRANPNELVVDQQRLPIHLAPGEPLELRFFIDGSVIELFAAGQTTFTKRFYYPGDKAPEIAVSITGNPDSIPRLSLWQLTPISKNRLTT